MLNPIFDTRESISWVKVRFIAKIMLLRKAEPWYRRASLLGPKIDQNSIKNGAKIDQKSLKIEVWEAPGQVWRRLGPSWAIQSVFGSILERLGGVLEGSWAGWGRERWPTWLQLGVLGGLGEALGSSWGASGAHSGFFRFPTSNPRQTATVNPSQPLHRAAVAETQRPLLGRIPEGLEY